MKQLYHVDMEQRQYSKLLSEIPPVDIVITMGCNVSCPSLPCQYREDWGLDDPTGKDDDSFLEVIYRIEKKVLELQSKIDSGLWEACKTIALPMDRARCTTESYFEENRKAAEDFHFGSPQQLFPMPILFDLTVL